MTSSRDTKEKKRKHVTTGRINGYLFVNLATVGALLVGLWTKSPVWDTSIRFPNLLLLLVIVNTVLIFRDILKIKPQFDEAESKGNNKKNKGKRHRSLWQLRKTLDYPLVARDDLLKNSLEILQKIVKKSLVELHYVYPHKSELVARAGDSVPQLTGNRMALKGEGIVITYTGKLGNEVLVESEKLSKSGRGTQGFRSKVTGLCYRAVSLNIAGSDPKERVGVLLFVNDINSKNTRLPVSISELVLYFELLMGLVEGIKKNQSLEYLDKNTGMELYSNFSEGLQTELERAERYEQNLSLLCLRIQSFESLTSESKQLVHENVGFAIKQVLRRFDRVFLGENPGEYFVLLSESDSKESEQVCNRIVKIFNKESDRLQPKIEEPLEMLVGAAVYPTEGTLAKVLLELSIEACGKKSDLKE